MTDQWQQWYLQLVSRIKKLCYPRVVRYIILPENTQRHHYMVLSSQKQVLCTIYNIGNQSRDQIVWHFKRSGCPCWCKLFSIFHQIFIFHQMIARQKYEKCFLFHLKSSFRSPDIQIFVFSYSPFFPLSAIALEVDSRKIL